MENIVMWIIDGMIAIVALILLFIGFKYWIDKGAEKFANSIQENTIKENQRLKQKVKTYKRLYKDTQKLVEIKQQELTELKEMKLEESEEEENEG